MIFIGNHVSVANGWEAMAVKETSLGGNTFAFFTRNPRGGNAKAPKEDDVRKLKERLAEGGFGPLVAHAPYTMNICSGKEDVRDFSLRVLREDLEKMEMLPGHYFNFHPGSHLGQGYDIGAQMIADALNDVLDPGQATTVLLETMTGKGTEVGGRFEELEGILERIRPSLQDKIGVCLDTCHVWDAGYDIAGNLDGVLEEFDRIIGMERLHAIHLNDSKNALGSHKDRHEKLGQGMIGLPALREVVRHPLLQGKPFILETPNEDSGYRREIGEVKSMIRE